MKFFAPGIVFSLIFYFLFFSFSATAQETDQEKQFAALLQAVKKGRTDEVRTALENGFDPNTAYAANGWTLIHIAAMNDANDIIRLLVSYGGNPDVADKSGMTPLSYTVSANKPKAIATLAEVGANLNYQIPPGNNTSLIMAILLNKPEAVKALMENGADPHIANSKGETATDYAQANALLTKDTLILNLLGSEDPAPKMSINYEDFPEGNGSRENPGKLPENPEPDQPTGWYIGPCSFSGKLVVITTFHHGHSTEKDIEESAILGDLYKGVKDAGGNLMDLGSVGVALTGDWYVVTPATGCKAIELLEGPKTMVVHKITEDGVTRKYHHLNIQKPPCESITKEIQEAEAIRDAFADQELLQQAKADKLFPMEYQTRVCEKVFGAGNCGVDSKGTTQGKKASTPMATDCSSCRIFTYWTREDYRLNGDPDCFYDADYEHELSHKKVCDSFRNPMEYCTKMSFLDYFSKDEIKAYQAKIDYLKDCLKKMGCD